MLTKEEISFLASQNLTPKDVYDGRQQTTTRWKAGVRAAGQIVVLGAPCKKAGHRLRTRSGHCVQCDTKKLAYQNRHHSSGFVYIAGSKLAKIYKIGTATDIEQRERNLRNQAYGGISDWKMLFYADVKNGGEVEGKALKLLADCRVSRTYAKDGETQEATELLRVTFARAIKAVSSAIGSEKPGELWIEKSRRAYDPS